MQQFVLMISCPDQRGIVAGVAGFLNDHGCNITDSQQFESKSTHRFFMRIDHRLAPEDYVAAGRDVESLVLSRAVKWHAEHRILTNGNTTVVFD